MGALRFGVSFYLAVVLATLAFVLLDLRPEITSRLQREASVRGFVSLDEVMSAARPCGSRPDAPLQASTLLNSDDDLMPMPGVSDSRHKLRASDLPGIVKLEPEVDLSQSEIAKGHCSATRISEKWFVTAAHCLSSGYDRIVLKAGSEELTSEAIRTVPVNYAICHAGFTGQEGHYENDLSLLRIGDAHIDALADIPITRWGMTEKPFSSDQFHVARVGGWGLKTYNGELNTHLQKMELDIVQIDKRFIRLSSRAGRGPCVGDSGGPLFVEEDGRPVLMGVLSTISANRFGEMCAGSYVSNYINLNAFRSWAFNTMAACDASDGRCREADPIILSAS